MASIHMFKGWPEKELFSQFCGNHVPFLSSGTNFSNYSEEVQDLLTTDISLVDISCAETNEVFNGNPSLREKVDMKASDFVDAWASAKVGRTHWSLSTGLNLYLSQHCLTKDNEDLCTSGYVTPSILKDSDAVIDQMNVWMNIFPATSTLHYDANNNILVVLEGQKDVTLFSPSATKFVRPAAAHNEYPNHSLLTPTEADDLAVRLRSEATTGCLAYSVTLSAGDALFIPEGWWHQVHSQKCTMALNFWFHSDMRPLLAVPREIDAGGDTAEESGVDMSSYLLRAALRKAVAMQRLADRQKEAQVQADATATSTFSAYRNDMTCEQFSRSALECLSLSSKGGSEDVLAAAENGNKRKRCAADPWTSFVACDIHAMRKYWIPFARTVVLVGAKIAIIFSRKNTRLARTNLYFHFHFPCSTLKSGQSFSFL